MLDTIYPDNNGIINLYGGEFGWDWFKHNDALTKANYAYVSYMYDETFLELLKDVLKEHTGATDVAFYATDDYNTSGYSYIDHESYGIAPSDRDSLKNFIFNKNSWLFGGNDNSSAEPTFYHVPEYKGGELVQPVYTYELTVEGCDETTRFLSEPTEDEIIDALVSILSGVKLYADTNNPADYVFDCNSKNSWNSSNKFFKLLSYYNDSFDFENNICYFAKDTHDDAYKEYDSLHPGQKHDDRDYTEIAKIRKRLLNQPNSPYKRAVKFFIKKLGDN